MINVARKIYEIEIVYQNNIEFIDLIVIIYEDLRSLLSHRADNLNEEKIGGGSCTIRNLNYLCRYYSESLKFKS